MERLVETGRDLQVWWNLNYLSLVCWNLVCLNPSIICTSQRPLSTMNIVITYQISSSFLVASTTLLLVTFSVEKCFLFQ